MAASSSTDAAMKKPRMQVGKMPFRTPHTLPQQPVPLPPDDDEGLYRTDEHVVRPRAMPKSLRQAAGAAGLKFKPELPDHFRHAVHRQGRKGADPLMRYTTTELVKQGVRFGSGGFDPEEEEKVVEVEVEKKLMARPYTEKELRTAFGIFDLNSNDFVDAAELRHIFSIIGECPSDNEISAMILLCDPRGDGCVNFDDFLNVFSNPAESLRNANLKGLKHLLPRKKIEFDIRDPLGIVLKEKTRIKDTSLMVVDVRKGSQAADAGVKPGWKLTMLEGEAVATEKDFDAKLAKLEKGAQPDSDDEGEKKSRWGAPKKSASAGEDKPKKQVKYDYAIVFEIMPGTEETESEEEPEEEIQQDIFEDEDDEDEDEDD